jgi:hypothetical protein
MKQEQTRKLGESVRFKKEYLYKLRSNPIVADENEEGGHYFRYGIQEHAEIKSGIICGRRRLVIEKDIEVCTDGDGRFWGRGYNYKYQSVYLIASNMSGFHRVPEEWILK